MSSIHIFSSPEYNFRLIMKSCICSSLILQWYKTHSFHLKYYEEWRSYIFYLYTRETILVMWKGVDACEVIEGQQKTKGSRWKGVIFGEVNGSGCKWFRACFNTPLWPPQHYTFVCSRTRDYHTTTTTSTSTSTLPRTHAKWLHVALFYSLYGKC